MGLDKLIQLGYKIEDFQVDIFRPAGRGVNDSSTAVRLTYKPLAIRAQSDEHRTYQQNLEWCVGAMIEALESGYV